MMRVDVIVGHRPSAPGAVAADGTTEHEMVERLANLLAGVIDDRHNVRVLSRPDHEWNDDAGRPAFEGTRIRSVVERVNVAGPDLALFLHANAHGGAATGSEALHAGSVRGTEAARLLASLSSHALGLRNRGPQRIDRSDRGNVQLYETTMPAVILEPWFMSNPADLAAARSGLPLLAQAIALGLDILAHRWEL